MTIYSILYENSRRLSIVNFNKIKQLDGIEVTLFVVEYELFICQRTNERLSALVFMNMKGPPPNYIYILTNRVFRLWSRCDQFQKIKEQAKIHLLFYHYLNINKTMVYSHFFLKYH